MMLQPPITTFTSMVKHQQQMSQATQHKCDKLKQTTIRQCHGPQELIPESRVLSAKTSFWNCWHCSHHTVACSKHKSLPEPMCICRVLWISWQTGTCNCVFATKQQQLQIFTLFSPKGVVQRHKQGFPPFKFGPCTFCEIVEKLVFQNIETSQTTF